MARVFTWLRCSHGFGRWGGSGGSAVAWPGPPPGPGRRPAREAGCGARQARRRCTLGIGQRVREVHLSQYCPGGLGFPAGSPSTTVAATGQAPSGWPDSAGHAAQAAGETCGRCGDAITGGQAVRRRASGDWVHETCREHEVCGRLGPARCSAAEPRSGTGMPPFPGSPLDPAPSASRARPHRPPEQGPGDRPDAQVFAHAGDEF